MAWWNRLFARKTASPPFAFEGRSAFKLYSEDGKREVEVLELRNGQAYLIESDWVEGTTFKARYSGRPVGPFASPEEAEAFIVATEWFCGRALSPPPRPISLPRLRATLWVLTETIVAWPLGLAVYLSQEKLLLSIGPPYYGVRQAIGTLAFLLSPLSFLGWINAIVWVCAAFLGVRRLRKRLAVRGRPLSIRKDP